MKKLGLLVAPLMAISFLVSCGGGSTPSTDIKFSVRESSVTLDDKTAVVNLDWEPSGDNIKFSDFTFNLTSESIPANVTADTEGDPRPVKVTIVFDSALTKDGKGDLKFHYNDTSSKKEGEGKVEGINIKLPIPDIHKVTEEEFKAALDFSTITDLKVTTTVTNDQTKVREIMECKEGISHLQDFNNDYGFGNNCDIYVTDEGNGLARYQPITDTTLFTNPYDALGYFDDSWEKVTSGVTSTELITPSVYINNYVGEVQYSDFTYSNGVYSNGEGLELVFTNKVLNGYRTYDVDHDFAASLEYEVGTITLPIVTAPSYQITEGQGDTVWNKYSNLSELSPDAEMTKYYFEMMGSISEITYSANLIHMSDVEEDIDVYSIIDESKGIYIGEMYDFDESEWVKTEYASKEELLGDDDLLIGNALSMIETVYNQCLTLSDSPAAAKSFDDFTYNTETQTYDGVNGERETAAYESFNKFINDRIVSSKLEMFVSSASIGKMSVLSFTKNVSIELPDFGN